MRSIRHVGVAGKCSKCNQDTDTLWSFFVDSKPLSEKVCADCALTAWKENIDEQ